MFDTIYLTLFNRLHVFLGREYTTEPSERRWITFKLGLGRIYTDLRDSNLMLKKETYYVVFESCLVQRCRGDC